MATGSAVMIPSARGALRFRRILWAAILTALVTLAPACASKAQPSGHTQTATAGPWRMDLTISPEHPRMVKPITFELRLTDGRGRPVNDAQVNGALTMKTMDMEKTSLNFTAKGNGSYEASLKDMDMSGPWKLAVEASQGSTHVQQEFEVVVGD